MDERYDENGNLKERFVDSKTGIEYVLKEDYYIPNIVAPSNIKNFRLGKYGRLRLNYLKTNKKAEYMILQKVALLQLYLQMVVQILLNLQKVQSLYMNMTMQMMTWL